MVLREQRSDRGTNSNGPSYEYGFGRWKGSNVVYVGAVNPSFRRPMKQIAGFPKSDFLLAVLKPS